MDFCIMSWICIFVIYTDGYAGGACEVGFREDCVMVEEVEQIVLWFCYLKMVGQ
jgi:hypothetical protein